MNIPQGLNRDKAIEFIKTRENWPKDYIVSLLATMTSKATNHHGVELKVGDVYISALNHPSLIFRISKGLVYSLTLTTESTYCGILMPCTSRFYLHSFITNCISVQTVDKVKEKGIQVYDKLSDVIKAKKLLKQFNNSLKL